MWTQQRILPMLRRYSAQFAILYKRPATLRYCTSTSDAKPVVHQEKETPINNNSVLEVYDPFEEYWEEDPEFDYEGRSHTPIAYDFISSNEYFTREEIKLLLEKENLKDVTVLDLPPGSFVDTMVIGSGVSSSHVRSAAGTVYQILKYKRTASKLGLPTVEGLKGTCGWIAIDLGNMLLHLFLPEVRTHYRLESLWSGEEIIPMVDDQDTSHSITGTSSMPGVINAFDWSKLIQEVQNERAQSGDNVRGSTDDPPLK